MADDPSLQQSIENVKKVMVILSQNLPADKHLTIEQVNGFSNEQMKSIIDTVLPEIAKEAEIPNYTGYTPNYAQTVLLPAVVKNTYFLEDNLREIAQKIGTSFPQLFVDLDKVYEHVSKTQPTPDPTPTQEQPATVVAAQPTPQPAPAQQETPGGAPTGFVQTDNVPPPIPVSTTPPPQPTTAQTATATPPPNQATNTQQQQAATQAGSTQTPQAGTGSAASATDLERALNDIYKRGQVPGMKKPGTPDGTFDSQESAYSLVMAIKLGLVREGLKYEGSLDGSYDKATGAAILQSLENLTPEQEQKLNEQVGGRKRVEGLIKALDAGFDAGVINKQEGAKFTISDLIEGMDDTQSQSISVAELAKNMTDVQKADFASRIIEKGLMEISVHYNKKVEETLGKMEKDGGGGLLTLVDRPKIYAPSEADGNLDGSEKKAVYQAIAQIKKELGFPDHEVNGEYSPEIGRKIAEKLKNHDGEIVKNMGGPGKVRAMLDALDILHLQNIGVLNPSDGHDVWTPKEESFRSFLNDLGPEVISILKSIVGFIAGFPLGNLVLKIIEKVSDVPIRKLLDETPENDAPIEQDLEGQIKRYYIDAVKTIGNGDPKALQEAVMDKIKLASPWASKVFKDFEKHEATIENIFKESNGNPDEIARRAAKVLTPLLDGSKKAPTSTPRTDTSRDTRDMVEASTPDGAAKPSGVAYNPNAGSAVSAMTADIKPEDTTGAAMDAEQRRKELYAATKALYEENKDYDGQVLKMTDPRGGVFYVLGDKVAVPSGKIIVVNEITNQLGIDGAAYANAKEINVDVSAKMQAMHDASQPQQHERQSQIKGDESINPDPNASNAVISLADALSQSHTFEQHHNFTVKELLKNGRTRAMGKILEQYGENKDPVVMVDPGVPSEGAWPHSFLVLRNSQGRVEIRELPKGVVGVEGVGVQMAENPGDFNAGRHMRSSLRGSIQNPVGKKYQEEYGHIPSSGSNRSANTSRLSDTGNPYVNSLPVLDRKQRQELFSRFGDYNGEKFWHEAGLSTGHMNVIGMTGTGTEKDIAGIVPEGHVLVVWKDLRKPAGSDWVKDRLMIVPENVIGDVDALRSTDNRTFVDLSQDTQIEEKFGGVLTGVNIATVQGGERRNVKFVEYFKHDYAEMGPLEKVTEESAYLSYATQANIKPTFQQNAGQVTGQKPEGLSCRSQFNQGGRGSNVNQGNEACAQWNENKSDVAGETSFSAAFKETYDAFMSKVPILGTLTGHRT